MPILLWGGAAVASLAGIKLAGDTSQDLAQLAKWGAIAGAVYVTGKYVKAF